MKKNKKQKKSFKLLSFFLIIVSIIFFSLLFSLNILSLNYIILCIGIIIFEIFMIYKLNHRSLVITKLLFEFLSIIFILGEIVFGYYLFFTLGFIDNIVSKKNIDNYGIYVLNDKYEDISNLNNNRAYIYIDDNYNEIIDYLSEYSLKINKIDSVDKAIKELTNDDSSVLIINESVINTYLDNNDVKLKKIYKFKITKKLEDDFNKINVKKNPFVVYISGVDSTGKIANYDRSDVNMLAVVNPVSGKILLVSTPRDYYVTLDGKNKKDKLTHAGLYGVSTSSKTLGLLYDVDVNYYIKINFSSFLNIIDVIEGIYVDVEKPDYSYNLDIYCGNGYICEQDSNRDFGNKLIKFKYGNRLLNGEEALAYSRNRHQYASGDNARGYHQQQVLKAIIEKLQSKDTILKYNKILSSLESGIKTNIDKDTITDFMNNQIKRGINWEISTIQATGSDDYKICYSTGNAKAYVMVPNSESVNEIKDKIKEVIAS